MSAVDPTRSPGDQSKRSRLEIVAESGHLIANDKPDAVVGRPMVFMIT
jgi:hypothetical protein